MGILETEPYRPPKSLSPFCSAWDEAQGDIVKWTVNVAGGVAAAASARFLFPEGIVPTGWEPAAAAVIGFLAVLGFYLVRGPVRFERKARENAEKAIRDRDKALRRAEAALLDRVPQAVVNKLARLRKELNREIWNKWPDAQDDFPAFLERWHDWHDRTLAYIQLHFTPAVADEFEDIGLARVPELPEEASTLQHMVIWKMQKLSEIVAAHTRATPLERYTEARLYPKSAEGGHET